MNVGKVLQLSTAHVPNRAGAPDFGGLRVAETEYGWIVFDCTMGVPGWLRPIVAASRAHGAFAIEFDRDNDIAEEFRTFADDEGAPSRTATD